MAFFRLDFSTQTKPDHKLLIPSELNLEVPFKEITKIQFRGNYPRRVEQYEVLCSFLDFYIRSPLAGIVYLQEKDNYVSFHLKVSGKNQISGLYSNHRDADIPLDWENQNDKKAHWVQFLNHYGLYSYEYETPLGNIFFRYQHLIFSLYDSYIPEFWQFLFSFYTKELWEFQKWIHKNFPEQTIEYYPDIRELKKRNFNRFDKYQYHHKYIYHKANHKKKIVFSPATLYALIRALFFREPFVKNIFVFKNYKEEQLWYGFYYHGTNLKEILSVPYCISFSMKEPIFLDQKPYLNIFNDYYYYYKERKENNICTTCFLCNNFCPVYANPMSLWEKKEFFKKEKCIMCGVCEEICESNLPLMEKIRHEIYP